MGKALF